MVAYILAHLAQIGSILLGLLLVLSEILALVNSPASAKAAGILDAIVKWLKDRGVQSPQ